MKKQIFSITAVIILATEIDISSQAKGIYFIKLYSGENLFLKKTIVLE